MYIQTTTDSNIHITYIVSGNTALYYFLLYLKIDEGKLMLIGYSCQQRANKDYDSYTIIMGKQVICSCMEQIGSILPSVHCCLVVYTFLRTNYNVITLTHASYLSTPLKLVRPCWKGRLELYATVDGK